jgi:PAS domain S-box-containing protein
VTGETKSRQQRRQWSFRSHVLTLVIACVLPMAGLSYYSMLQLGASQRNDQRSDIVGTARAISSTIDQRLGDAIGNLRALGSLLPRDDGALADFYADCLAIARESGGWVLLVDADGEQIFNTRRPLGATLPRVTRSPDFRDVVATGKPFISNLVTTLVDPEPAVAVLVPIAGEGKATRVLLMGFPTRSLGDMLVQQHLPQAWTLTIVDRKGAIIATQGGASPTGAPTVSPRTRYMPPEDADGFFLAADPNGNPIHEGVARSPLSGWKAVVGLPEAVIDAPLRRTLEHFAAIAGAVLLLTMGAAWLIARHLAGDMRSLAGAAQALGRRDALPPVASTVREVNRVASALSEAGTELVESDRRLRRSQQHFLHAQRLAGMGSIDRNLKTGEAEWTDETLRLFGVDRDNFEPTPDNILALVHPEDRERVRASMDAVRQGIKPEPMEYRLVRPDGEIRRLRRSSELSVDEQGVPNRVFITFVDVTELRAAEQRMRRSEQHLALAQRVSQTGSVLTDITTGVDEWSDQLYRLLDLEPGAAPPTFETYLQRVHEDDRAMVRDARDASLRGEQRWVEDCRIVWRDGQIRVLHHDVEPIFDGPGPPTRFVVIFRDVTEPRRSVQRQRELEQQLQHAQKLDALGTLAGGIAHDLNNTLVPVLGLAKLTMRRLPEGGRDRANLATILQAGERARDLVRQILAFSRKEQPTRQATDLAALLRDSLKMLSASLPSTIRIDERIESVPLLLADPGQLHQIVINLIVNAAQAIGDEMGTIAVSLAAAPAGTLDGELGGKAAPAVHLAVRDTGCGIDMATQRRVFEPFFTTKAVGEGTGLGLSVVHGIVVQHGGRITVSSRVGQGTRFDVYLPALTSEEETRELETAAMAI